MKDNNNIILIAVALVTLFSTVLFSTYAYFSAGLIDISNAANVSAVTEANNMVFDTLGGDMLLNVTTANMVETKSGNIAAEDNTTLTVNFTSNTAYSMVCTYDIVYEWVSTDRYTTHTQGVTDNEFSIQASLASNVHVNEGTNSIKNEKDLSTAVGNNAYATVVSGAMIDAIGSTTSTAIWTLTGRFHNVDADQSALAGKDYAGKFRVANVSCVSGSVALPGPTSYWFASSTYNSNTDQMEPLYTHPNYGGTLQSSGTATGHNVYIGQDSSKYYACGTTQGHEVCLSQPYTQYGLSGHTPCNDSSCYLTSEQKASAKQAIYQAFIDAGITVDINNDCFTYNFAAGCKVGDLDYVVNTEGFVHCYDYSEQVLCRVDALGRANCES